MATPERTWPSIARKVATWRIRRREKLSDDELATIQAVVGNQSIEWINDHYWPAWLGLRYLSWLQLLAVYPPRSWRPPAMLEGREQIEKALAAGCGAILWTPPFAFNDLFTKAAVAQADLKASLVLRPSHGFTGSRFGRSILNPIYTRIERRYLRDMILLSDGSEASALDEVKARLADNQLIIVYAVPLGRRLAIRPLGDGQIRIATGILNLACETKCAVLPTFTLRRNNGQVVTTIHEGLPMPSDRSRAEVIEQMLDRYVPLLEAAVRDYPEQLSYPLSQADGQLLIESPLTYPPNSMQPLQHSQ